MFFVWIRDYFSHFLLELKDAHKHIFIKPKKIVKLEKMFIKILKLIKVHTHIMKAIAKQNKRKNEL